eukprot:7271887-Pyramimonas_sp.AAC.1
MRIFPLYIDVGGVHGDAWGCGGGHGRCAGGRRGGHHLPRHGGDGPRPPQGAPPQRARMCDTPNQGPSIPGIYQFDPSDTYKGQYGGKDTR